jgi:hypothetical protein
MERCPSFVTGSLPFSRSGGRRHAVPGPPTFRVSSTMTTRRTGRPGSLGVTAEEVDQLVNANLGDLADRQEATPPRRPAHSAPVPIQRYSAWPLEDSPAGNRRFPELVADEATPEHPISGLADLLDIGRNGGHVGEVGVWEDLRKPSTVAPVHRQPTLGRPRNVPIRLGSAARWPRSCPGITGH